MSLLGVAIELAKNDESFVDVSDFDGSESGEDRSQESNFVGRKGNHD
jgi:hypothetical protein